MFDELTMKRCPICHKNFDMLSCDQWVYKRKRYGGGGYTYYCSWHCMREDERGHEKKRRPLTLEEADRMPGVRRPPTDSRKLLDETMKVIEEKGPEAAAEHLESLGFAWWKKWNLLKHWAEKHDPELRERMPERLRDNRVKEAAR